MSKNMAVLDNNNKVINIIVASDDTQENNNLITYTENNPAFIDGDYIDGYFYSPQPYPSWTRDNGNWLPPVAHPNDGKFYSWDEATLTWVEDV